MFLITHQHGQQDYQHLFLAGREFIGQKPFAVLIKDNVIAFTVDFLTGIAEQFVNHILKFPFRHRQGGSQTSLLFVTAQQLNHFVTDIHLIIKITALEQIELPIQFGLYIRVCHAGGEISHNKRTVIAADYIIRNKSRFRIVEENMYTVFLIALYLSRSLLKVAHRTV